MKAWPAVKVVLNDQSIHIYEQDEIKEVKNLKEIFGYSYLNSTLVVKYHKEADPEGGVSWKICKINNVVEFENNSSLEF